MVSDDFSQKEQEAGSYPHVTRFTDRHWSCCPLLEAEPEASSEAREGAGRGGRIDTNPCHSLHWTLHVTLIHFPWINIPHPTTHLNHHQFYNTFETFVIYFPTLTQPRSLWRRVSPMSWLYPSCHHNIWEEKHSSSPVSFYSVTRMTPELTLRL